MTAKTEFFNILSSDIISLICEYLSMDTLHDMDKSKCFGEETSYEIQKRIMEYNIIQNEIIEIYSRDQTKSLCTSGFKLYEELEHVMNKIHSEQKYIMNKWKNSDNEIIDTFIKCYEDHYINNNKNFINMKVGESFAASVMMFLYH